MRKREKLTLAVEPQAKLAVDTVTAAEMMGLAPGTLENWRYKSPYEGPAYARIGKKVVYPVAALEAYIAEHVERG